MEQSKKELELNGIQAAEFLIESGDDVLPRYIEISKQIALLEAEKKTLKEAAFDERALFGSNPVTIAGCKISISNTGDRIQYDKDPIIAEYKKAIKDREIDVKTAVKSTGVYFDADGVQVEKVPVRYGSDVIKIQF
tara:strand:+ start:10837 stop:11244 length:408 start_codon:yes stop_codon:yes gene_type:complete